MDWMRESGTLEWYVMSQSGSDESDQVDARLPLRVLVIGWGMCGARTMRKRLYGRQNWQISG